MNNKKTERVKAENMSNQQMQLLLQIQEQQFTAIELNLYLDTHPNEQRALDLYNSATIQLKKDIEKYEQHCGPLYHFGLSTGQLPWQWIDSPWPWEM